MSIEVIPRFPARSYEFHAYAPARNFIGGEWRDAAAGETIPVENPRHGKPMSRVPMSGRPDVDAAVEAARAAWPSWRERPIRERAQVFYRLKQLMETDKDELSWLVSHENGKTIEEGRASVDKAIECIEFGCSLPNLAAGDQL